MHKLWCLVFFVLSTRCETFTEHDLKEDNYREDGYQRSSCTTPETTYLNNAELQHNELVNNTRHKRSTATSECPQLYQLVDEYCVRITGSHSWNKAFQQCYLQGIEKTPLDSRLVWFNASTLANIWSKLPSNISSVWLPAQQKYENAPIYYSGPIPSDFSYEFYFDKDFNLTWSDTKTKSQTNCLMLDFRKKELVLMPCYTELPFVCLFPSILWSSGLVVNSFHKYQESNIFTWESAQHQCQAASTGFTLIPEHILKNNSASNETKWIGVVNTCLQTDVWYSESSIQVWFKNIRVIPRATIYQTLNGTNSCNKNETYYCLERTLDITPRILLKQTNDCYPAVYNVTIENVDKICRIYKIKCYLNDLQLIEIEDSITIHRPGKLFCEALTFPPLSLLKSNTEIVKCSSDIIFILEIYDLEVNFSSKWLYDGYLTARKLYIRPLRRYIRMDDNEHFINYPIYIQSISAQKVNGIAVTFVIIVPLKSNVEKLQLLKNCSSQFQRLFPIGKTIPLRKSGEVVIKSLTNTEYCLEDFTQVNYTNCTSQIIKWPMTLASQSAISTPVCTICSEDKVLKRSCTKHESLGAKWSEETLEIFQSPACFAEKAASVLRHENVTNKISTLINEFDDLFKHKTEVTQQTYTYSNLSVSFLRTSLDLFQGFKYYNNQNDSIFNIIRNNTLDANGSMPDIMVWFRNETFSNSTLLHLKTDDYVTVAVFKKMFPNSESLTLASPVVHIDFKATPIVAANFSAYFRLNQTESVQDCACGHWDFKNHEWSTENGIYMGYADGYHHCVFSHTSSFALLLKVKPTVSLSIISLIGCVLSIVGLSMLIFSYLFLSNKHKDNYERELLLNLAVSLVCMYLIFLFGFHQVHIETLCIINGALLHYFTLASFCWMMVKAYDAYLKYVKVLDSYISWFLLKASLIAWGIPAIFVLIVAIADYKLFRNDHSCHISSYGFYYAFLLPIGVVVIVNMCIFLLILINIFCRRTKLRTNQQKDKLLWLEIRMSMSNFLLFGLTWIFGFLATIDNSSVFSYLFCITTPLQGFFMFLLYVLINTRIQKGWKHICCKQSNENASTGATGTAVPN